MKRSGVVVLIIVIAAAILVLWPAPDPLKGVQAVAVGNGSDAGSDIFSGLEIALGDHKIAIVSDPAKADAVITLLDVKAGDLNFSINNSGAQGSLHLVCEVEKNGQRSLMDLYITYQNGATKAELVGRKFYEVWK
ncbi:hypothetical protein HY229_09095 [Candidatus Acetothermia bacterium]|nr:hypothetical protein [Candidatus Acetothermia bacterium]MBI3644238.1 hypothetical protein [Candidatus Acetothermia bacterium]